MKSAKWEVTRVAGPLPGSASCVMVITHIMYPDEGTKQPHDLYATPLQAVRVPSFPSAGKGVQGKQLEEFKQKNAAAFRESEAAKLAESVRTGLPMSTEGVFVTRPGGDTLKVAKFQGLDGISTGFFKVNGLTFDMYQDRPTFKCSGASPVSLEEAMRLCNEIPFAERSFDFDADIPNAENREAFKDDYTRKLLVIKIDKEAEPGDALWGTFGAPDDISKCVSSYDTADGVTLLALTGGLNAENKVQDNALLVKQRTGDECPAQVLCMTKLHEPDLFRLQTEKWPTFAFPLTASIRGTLFATVDRRGSAKINISSPDLMGVVHVGSMFIPDLARVASLAGYPVSWETCTKLVPTLKDATRVDSNSRLSLNWLNAVNILEYTGDISCVSKAADKGWIQMYLVTNHLFNEAKKAGLRKKSQDELYAILSNPEDFYNDKLEMIMYATLTDAAPPGYAITDFVSKGRPRALVLFDNEPKRVKTEQ